MKYNFDKWMNLEKDALETFDRLIDKKQWLC